MATGLISARDIYGFLEPEIEFSSWIAKIITEKKSFLIKDEDVLCDFGLAYEIISNYFDMVIPYLSYHFNDTKVKNEKKKVEKIKEIFLRQITELIEDYKKCLERLIK
jgi:hypothetical protein